ncbi:MAG: 3-oxoacyl-ACP reductase FabG [Candidatus Aminicenantes bacterium]|nr:3-oxoacyl-ACP reductase FabG [Candidatus Aminicenantes bacterium]MCJ7487365.1 3-oxoacyl-ACP reductase FabG [Candidatus Aminicenantes bacterium]TFG55045.1 MAG: 3-oxoacyl-ACP reductase FabG [Candidatus Aminicenantes bacterium]HUT07716.1 3-oxoacyl-ACP reductase family protein [Candidatus Latescibacterota bacterium]
MIRLDGRKVLVTGGSRGIGRATALLFAQAGADVALSYVSNQKAAEEVLKRVEQLGRRCLVYKAEMSSRSDIDHMAADILAKWGELDTLVNNAGVWTYLEMGRMDDTVYRETIGINVDGVFYATNAVVPAMKEHGRGSIINVTSTAGVRGEAFHSHYAASKGALHSLTKSLAVELAPFGIRVNAVAPGWVDTDMSAPSFSEPGFKEKVRQTIPLKRIPLAEDIAGPILFLASDLARHITGEILDVNGGSVLCGG